jgi:Ca2+-dependent lipid-binding protein
MVKEHKLGLRYIKNYGLYRVNYSLHEVLCVQVFDFDNGSEDDFLGRTSIPVTSIMDNTDIFDRQVEVQVRIEPLRTPLLTLL